MSAPTAPPAEPLPGQSKRPQRGQEIELKIDSLAHGGEGVARWGPGGYVVFVAGAVPGDRVRAVVYKPKRSYAHARTLEVLEPSPERIAPRAEHPGVPWQVLPYERQLQIKQEQVGDALRRIGKLEGFELEEIVPAVQQWRYRNKLEYSFGMAVEEGEAPLRSAVGAGDEEMPVTSAKLVCGFHASAGGNRVVEIEDCLLASELGNLARDTAAAWAREQGLGAWTRGDEPSGVALLRNLVVREGRHTGQVQLRLVTTPGEVDVYSLAAALGEALGESLSGLLWTRSGQLAETTMGGETELVSGSAELPERLGELDLRISYEAFFQTNTEMTEVLYGLVTEYAALEGWERVFDLYCGIGTIGLTLAPRAGELWGIELIEEAVANAIAAARRNEITNAHFFAGDTRLALPELLEKAGKPDVVVVDPPRAGLSAKVVRRVIDTSPKRIVYVSCNPTTLAPNAAQLVEAGWTLHRVRPVDMFPQTHHVECVALFER
ncbi:MAG TPA: 23S rRNA (uracil(1939)-C(5))-methyltransferase RlmD [Solirubrobacteraceae bacterium]